MRYIHPFPARMAPEIALNKLSNIPRGGVVLDPMVGSGTVVSHATKLGYKAMGFDLDPLAVMMSKVLTTPVDDNDIVLLTERVVSIIKSFKNHTPHLPWIDDDEETKSFVNYWFGQKQQDDLRRIAYTLHTIENRENATLDVLKIALSRIIVTKKEAASLARDTSHSRPHKVQEESDYNVLPEFEKSVSFVRKKLAERSPKSGALIRLGDARTLNEVDDNAVDFVMTSPPYLNAIDYMRGHKMALVWLGYSVGTLRKIRSNNIGANRGLDGAEQKKQSKKIMAVMGDLDKLPASCRMMVSRFSQDLYRMVSEISRVLKPNSKAVFVMGDSCLRSVFIENTKGLIEAARMVGLELEGSLEKRVIPPSTRYLPINSQGSMGKRMREENICTLVLR